MKSYVDGYMHGEAMAERDGGDLGVIDFNIV